MSKVKMLQKQRRFFFDINRPPEWRLRLLNGRERYFRTIRAFDTWCAQHGIRDVTAEYIESPLSEDF